MLRPEDIHIEKITFPKLEMTDFSYSGISIQYLNKSILLELPPLDIYLTDKYVNISWNKNNTVRSLYLRSFMIEIDKHAKECNKMKKRNWIHIVDKNNTTSIYNKMNIILKDLQNVKKDITRYFGKMLHAKMFVSPSIIWMSYDDIGVFWTVKEIYMYPKSSYYPIYSPKITTPFLDVKLDKGESSSSSGLKLMTETSSDKSSVMTHFEVKSRDNSETQLIVKKKISR